MKTSPHNQRYIENISKLLYAVEDSYDLYNFLGVDLKELTTLTDSVAAFFSQNPALAAKAFEGQMELPAQMNKLITTQRTLVEAANASPYGWSAAKHMEEEHGIFSNEDKTNTKALRDAKMAVRRDNREFKAHRGNSTFCGRGAKRTRWEANNQAVPTQATKAVQDWAAKNVRTGGANHPANKLGKTSGKPLECFKCGATTHLVANCNQP